MRLRADTKRELRTPPRETASDFHPFPQCGIHPTAAIPGPTTGFASTVRAEPVRPRTIREFPATSRKSSDI
jgi:hypothetical protein